MKSATALIAIAAATLFILGCAGEPVIADIGQDKVQIQANGAKPEQIDATAERACAMYQRRAQAISYRCADQYCIQKIMLYACIPPAASATPMAGVSGVAPGGRVICSFPGSPNPNLARVELASSACVGSGGVVIAPAK